MSVPPSPSATRRATRRDRTTRAVVLLSLLLVAACVGWAVLAQVLVPDACAGGAPPPRAQYVHCG